MKDTKDTETGRRQKGPERHRGHRGRKRKRERVGWDTGAVLLGVGGPSSGLRRCLVPMPQPVSCVPLYHPTPQLSMTNELAKALHRFVTHLSAHSGRLAAR